MERLGLNRGKKTVDDQNLGQTHQTLMIDIDQPEIFTLLYMCTCVFLQRTHL